MALSNSPFGLMPLNGILNTPFIQYQIYSGFPADDGSLDQDIFTGDPVQWANNGTYGDGVNTSGTIVPARVNATYSNARNNIPILGVFLGCEYFDPTGMLVRSRAWRASTPIKANTKVTANIARDPNIAYAIQVSCMDGGAVLANAVFDQIQIPQNFAFGLGGGGGLNNPTTGDFATGRSAYYLNAVGLGGTDYTVATLPLKVLGYQTGQNIYLSDGSVSPFVQLIVKLNNHIEHAGQLGYAAF